MSAAQARLERIPAQVACVADWAALARERVDPAAWAYLDGAAGDGLTAADNRAAFDRLRLRPRVLADVAGGDTRLRLFGHEFVHPLLVAPVGSQGLAHPDGELATARGAAALQAGLVIATLANHPMEDVIAHAPGVPHWFQLYWQRDREATLALVRRAEAAGCSALVLTVDLPLATGRQGEQRSGFTMPATLATPHLAGLPVAPGWQAAPGGDGPLRSPLLAAAARWHDLAWLRAQTRLPLLLKGVLDPEDALRALDHGSDGLIVSNHGGRSLDGVPASLDALPAIAAAVAGRVPLLLDGGIRRGADALKARALGADAVLVGRGIVHGLAAAGAAGVAHVLHLLRTELETAMALCGCRTWADVGPGVLWRHPPRDG